MEEIAIFIFGQKKLYKTRVLEKHYSMMERII
jgi:hypothetical protein